MSEQLQLNGLQIKNFMKIGLVRLTFKNGEMCVIGGKNAQGKSAVLKAFEALMGGKRAIPADPVKHGAKACEILADLGAYTAKLAITTKGGPKLTVKTRKGEPVQAPMTLFNGFCSHVGFRPLAFMGMDRHEQAEVLMKLARLDFAEVDAEYDDVFRQRREVGRDVTALEGQVAGLPFDDDAPGEVVNVAALVEQVRKASDSNRARWDAKNNLSTKEATLATLAQSITEVEAKLSFLKDSHQSLLKDIERHTSEFAELKEIDTEPLQKQIDKAETTNNAVRANQAHLNAKARLDKEQDKHVQLSSRLDRLKMEKADALAHATFPVEGLGLDEDNLPTFNGISTENISGAEQLHVSAAVGLALNPKLKVLLIDDGEKLDMDSLKQMAEFAKKNDAVLIMTRVSTGDECTVEIVDGEIAKDGDK